MTEKYVPPTFQLDGFHCPFCEVYAHQLWNLSRLGSDAIKDFHFSRCVKCQKISFWVGGKLIYPVSSSAPMPSEDMPDDVRETFLEARNILSPSPRGAAALLRLSIQQLMIFLKEKGKNINDDIGSLVEKGLPERIQKALDSVRVIGNYAVHPGQIDIKDDQATALLLFELVNLIVEDRISKDKKIDAIYDKLPDGVKDGIEKRDSGKK